MASKEYQILQCYLFGENLTVVILAEISQVDCSINPIFVLVILVSRLGGLGSVFKLKRADELDGGFASRDLHLPIQEIPFCGVHGDLFFGGFLHVNIKLYFICKIIVASGAHQCFGWVIMKNAYKIYRSVNVKYIKLLSYYYLYCPMQKYEIMSAIGEGAYGVVLKCRDVENNSYVAIKKFKDSDDDELTKKTTMREVKILKMLSHENIVEMKEAFRKKGIVYLVFEYVENNLLEVLEKSPSGLQPNIIRKLMYQLIKGLAYLHDLDIVHRDVKPENLLVSSRYDLKICDFGFARLNKKQKGEAQMTDYVATRWYRPPQLLVGGEYGKEIDMWGVGCIMCELIDGNPLFPGQNELDQLFLIQKTFGPLPPQLHERFIKNQRFLGMKFPQIQNLDLVDKKYFGKIDPKGLSLIKSLLKMLPGERITAQQALNHPYFDQQKSKSVPTESTSNRKEIYSSTTNRRKEEELEPPQNIERLTKYGKIYNKRKTTTNYNQIALIYQSSNQQKIYNQYQSKSVNKTSNKKTNNFNHNTSLEKRDNLFKTEGRGFYIDRSEDKLECVDLGRKTQEMGWQSSNQLPLLITNSSNYNQQAEPATALINKKKPQIYIQKTQASSNFNSNKPNLQNLIKK